MLPPNLKPAWSSIKIWNNLFQNLFQTASLTAQLCSFCCLLNTETDWLGFFNSQHLHNTIMLQKVNDKFCTSISISHFGPSARLCLPVCLSVSDSCFSFDLSTPVLLVTSVINQVEELWKAKINYKMKFINFWNLNPPFADSTSGSH